MRHELKIWPQYYEAVAGGEKTFEVRVNDRNFQRGDEVELRYFDPEFKPSPIFSQSEIDKMSDARYPRLSFKVGYVLPIDQERVVFSLLPVGEP